MPVTVRNYIFPIIFTYKGWEVTLNDASSFFQSSDVKVKVHISVDRQPYNIMLLNALQQQSLSYQRYSYGFRRESNDSPQALEQYERDLSAFKERRSKEPRNTKGFIDDSEAYRDAMHEYTEAMHEYNRQAATYGPIRLSIDDFLILKYVYPEINNKTIVLQNDDIYEVPQYLRGRPVNDITFVDKPFKHLKSYHEFLQMNPNISEQSNDSKYQIRASKRSGWTL